MYHQRISKIRIVHHRPNSPRSSRHILHSCAWTLSCKFSSFLFAKASTRSFNRSWSLRWQIFVHTPNTPLRSAKNLQSAGVTLSTMSRGCHYSIVSSRSLRVWTPASRISFSFLIYAALLSLHHSAAFFQCWSHLVSGRRKALAPFIFSDDPRVPTGAWIHIPSVIINRDAEFYTDPLRFDGFRFARGSPSSFTDTSENWMFWGTGRVIWWVVCL